MAAMMPPTYAIATTQRLRDAARGAQHNKRHGDRVRSGDVGALTRTSDVPGNRASLDGETQPGNRERVRRTGNTTSRNGRLSNVVLS